MMNKEDLDEKPDYKVRIGRVWQHTGYWYRLCRQGGSERFLQIKARIFLRLPTRYCLISSQEDVPRFGKMLERYFLEIAAWHIRKVSTASSNR